MRILDRYILNEFLKVFFLTTAAFITLDVLVEFLDKADMLFKHGSGLSEAAQFFLYQVPFIFYQTVPVSILLATLVSLGTLSRHNEITAVKSNGISVLKIITPILLFSVLITGVSIMLNEYCLPLTNRRVERIRREKVEGKPKSSNYG
ncbi:MAG: LptF/LptG family permease, partial [Deltaproteobacteria bacterium]|nr:LptF/LptG family permease [Deltaproteobacteria bacterium]